MKPVVDRLVGKYQGTVDVYVYAEADRDARAASFARQHGVSAVPTTVIVDPLGREVQRFVGVTSEDQVSRAVESAR